MPQLPNYSATLGQLPIIGGRYHPAIAEDFGGGMGQAAEHVAQAGQQFYTGLADSEAQSAIVGTAQIRAKYAQLMNDAATSGADLDKIKQNMNDELSKLGDNMVTRKGRDALDVHSATTNQLFNDEANHIAVVRAGVNAKIAAQNWKTSTDATLYGNPSYLPIALKDAEDFAAVLPNVSPEVKAEIAERLKSEANVTAAMASAKLEPEVTQMKLETGSTWTLTGEERRHVAAAAQQQITSNRVSEEHEQAMAVKAEKQRVDRINEGLMDKFVNNTLTVDTVTNAGLPAFGEGSRDAWNQRLKTQAKEELEKPIHTDPDVFNNLRGRIDLKAGDPRRILSADPIWQAYVNSADSKYGLSKDDAILLEKRFTDNKSGDGQRWAAAESETINNLKHSLDKSTLLSIDSGGGERVQAFTIHLRQKAEQYRQANKDEYRLLDPSAPDYIGRDLPAFMSGAQLMQKGIVSDVDKALRPKPAAGTPQAAGPVVIKPMPAPGEPIRKSLDEIFKGKK